MGFREKMMDGMMGRMSSQERKDMMDKMMESFFSNMTKEEKQDMMKDMMPKMMGTMMGGGEGPMDMCQKMMGSFQETAESAKFATPEVRNLFEEWSAQIEEEIYEFIKTAGEVNPEKIAEHFKLSKDSIMYFLKKLAEKGKIKFQANL